MDAFSDSKKLYGYLAAGAALIVFLVVFIRCAWLCDDAYISFRVVDNFVNGYGLRWNIAERVQVFTNPLWTLLLSAFYLVTREMYITPLALSMVISLATMILIVFRLSRSVTAAALGFALLLFSKFFVDYSTSGLENPLIHLLLVVFVLIYFRETDDARRLLYLALTVALILVNRMDTLLLILPALLYALYGSRCGWPVKIRSVLFGFTPFFIWQGFALLYYGFLFPNTAYAKLSTGISQWDYLVQGWHYLVESTRLDFLTLPATCVVAAAALGQRRDKRLIPLAAGVLLHLLYVVKVGGDSMGGRFITAPFVLSAVLLVRLPEYQNAGWLKTAAAVMLIALAGLYSPAPSLITGANFGSQLPESRHGVNDTRQFFYHNTGLLHRFQGMDMPRGAWVESGCLYRRAGSKFEINNSIGLVGFYAGPETHILDVLALGDPLLSRLQIDDRKNWAIAHFERTIPHGYIETLKTGGNKLLDQGLALFYGRLCNLTRGDVFAAERLKEIARFNLGLNDRLISQYSSASIDGQLLEDSTYTQVLSTINRSIELDRQGRMDEAAALHLDLSLGKQPMMEEDLYYWGEVLYALFRDQNSQRWQEDAPEVRDMIFMLRMALLENDMEIIRSALRIILSRPVPPEFYLTGSVFISQRDLKSLLGNILAEKEEVFAGSSFPALNYLNLAILCDAAGQPSLATDLYGEMLAMNIELPDEVRGLWLRVIDGLASAGRLSLGDGVRDASTPVGLLLKIINGSDSSGLVVADLASVEMPGEGWRNFQRIVRLSGKDDVADAVAAIIADNDPN